jgi:hypothetical protein
LLTVFQVREIEYKDKMEEEWSLFQKSMKAENTVRKFYFGGSGVAWYLAPDDAALGDC